MKFKCIFVFLRRCKNGIRAPFPKSGFMNSINNNIRLSIFVFQFSSAGGKRNSNSPNAFCFLFFSEKWIWIFGFVFVWIWKFGFRFSFSSKGIETDSLCFGGNIKLRNNQGGGRRYMFSMKTLSVGFVSRTEKYLRRACHLTLRLDTRI